MKKASFALLLMVIFSRPLQADGVTAYHKLKPGETLWFVSQIYYDDGNSYGKILAANHILRAEDVVVDQELLIPEPKWLETMPEFASHFKKISGTRAFALAKIKMKKTTALAKHAVPEKANPVAPSVPSSLSRTSSNVEK